MQITIRIGYRPEPSIVRATNISFADTHGQKQHNKCAGREGQHDHRLFRRAAFGENQ